MVLPPSDAGAFHVTSACWSPGVAVADVGGSGTAAGVTAFDVLDGDPVPTALVAVTVNVYAVPLVRPVMVQPSVVVVQVRPSGDEVAV